MLSLRPPAPPLPSLPLAPAGVPRDTPTAAAPFLLLVLHEATTSLPSLRVHSPAAVPVSLTLSPRPRCFTLSYSLTALLTCFLFDSIFSVLQNIVLGVYKGCHKKARNNKIEFACYIHFLGKPINHRNHHLNTSPECQQQQHRLPMAPVLQSRLADGKAGSTLCDTTWESAFLQAPWRWAQLSKKRAKGALLACIVIPTVGVLCSLFRLRALVRRGAAGAFASLTTGL